MRNPILTLSLFFLIASCKDVKKQIEKFIFDSSKITEVTKYYYKYNAGKKTNKIEIFNIYYAGKIVDSVITNTAFAYNDNGLIKKEISITSSSDNDTIYNLYTYDSNDSLIIKLTINSKGDTTHWVKYKSFPDGKRRIFKRDLFLNINSFEEVKDAFENKKYDTLIDKNEYLYKDKLCKELKRYDNKNQITDHFEFEYQNEKVTKEYHYTFINSLKMLQSTKYHDYSKNKINPDYYSLDFRGDTIEKEINEFEGGKLALSISLLWNEFVKFITKDFYKDGKVIGTIEYFNDMGKEAYKYTSFDYYPNGDIKEEKSYREETQQTNN